MLSIKETYNEDSHVGFQHSTPYSIHDIPNW